MGSTVELRTPDGTRAFSCLPGERLLYAALRAGAEPAYGCATGTCGNCRATVLEGSVITAWADAPALRAVRRPDEILLCQSVAESDCVVKAGSAAWSHPRERAATYEATVSRVVPSAEGLCWIEIQLDRPMCFHAGQFVLLSMEGVEGFRAYSPAHDGNWVSRLSFVVRDKAGGGLSPRLCSLDSVGQAVKVFGPLGSAHVRPTRDQDMAIVVGGSGCAVALSLLDWALRTNHLERYRIDVVCGMRSSHCSEVIARLSAAMAASHPERLRIVLALSDVGEPPTRNALAGLGLERGLAHEVAKRVLSAEAWRERAVFVAGPAPMVEATLRMLMVDARLGPKSIRYDSF